MASVEWQWKNLYPKKTSGIIEGYNSIQQDFDESEFYVEEQKDLMTTYKGSNKINGPKTDQLKDAYSLYRSKKLLPTFTRLDFLLPEPYLLPGCLTVLHTSDKAGRAFSIQFFIRIMLKYYDQGVIFIDCTNVFPAYEFIEATIDYDPLIDPQLPIRAVQLSRSFNYHQVTETVKEQLEPLLRDGFSYNTTDTLAEEQEKRFVKPRIVIIAGLSDLYLNTESAQYLEYDGRPAWWSIFELQETIGYLRSLTLKYDCVTIISSSTAPLSKTKPLGGRFLSHSAGVIIRLTTEGPELTAELIKHPFVKSKTIPLQILKKKGKKRATVPLKYFYDK